MREKKLVFLSVLLSTCLFSAICIAETANVNVSNKPVSSSTPDAKISNTTDTEDSYISETDSSGAESEIVTIPDRYESFNRVMFKLNDKLERYLIKPVARLYNKIIPHPINIGVDNFYNNILQCPTIVNDMLQANFYQATSDTWRLMVNTVGGVGGVFDIADRIGLQRNYEGYGLTFAKWGWKNSNYLFIPVFGPQTVRDAIALPMDYFTTPIPYLARVTLRHSLFVLGIVDKYAQIVGFEGVYQEVALDPYVFMRNAYAQRRAYQIKRNTELNNPYTAENTQKYEEDYYLDE